MARIAFSDSEEAPMTSTDATTKTWFAYKDEDGYWIESGGKPPCLSLWTPLRDVWEYATVEFEKKKERVVHLRAVWFGDPIYDYVCVPPPIAYLLTPHES